MNCFKLKQKDQANIGVEQSSTQRNKARGNDVKSTTSEIELGTFDYQCLGEFYLLKMDSGNKHVLIADSGASCHLTGTLEGMVDRLKIYESVIVGNGQADGQP